MRLTPVAVYVVLAVPPALDAAAQVAPDSASRAASPYSELRIRLSGARNVNRPAIHEYWTAGVGAGFGISTPFYRGSVGVGATLIPYEARDDGRPSFRALLLGLDWGGLVAAPGPIRVRAAARVGDFVMLVENPDVWLDSESELFVAGELSAALAVRRDLALTLAGSIAHVFTRPSLDLAVVSLGLEHATRTPRWLRAILE